MSLRNTSLAGREDEPAQPATPASLARPPRSEGVTIEISGRFNSLLRQPECPNQKVRGVGEDGSGRAIHPITPSISAFSPSAAPLAEATR
jgi:hypothetical protein